MEDKEKRVENVEAEVFKALDHQMRRDILRYVGEGRNPIRIPDSPALAYHLKSLSPFIEQRTGTSGPHHPLVPQENRGKLYARKCRALT